MNKLVKINFGIALNALHLSAMDLTKRYEYWIERERNTKVRYFSRVEAARFAGECLGKLYRLQEERDAVVMQISGRPHPQEEK